jgi:hypothetical protein
MLGGKPVRDVTIFVSLYLLLSLPPFLALNRELSPVVTDIAVLAVLGTGLIVVIAALFLAEEGVDRFTQFLLGPTDIPSIVVDAMFVLAAVSWWLVPEIAFYLGRGLELRILLVVVLICHLPAVLILSLMTAIGKTKVA